MPWPRHHKKQTRERIVDAAAAALRANGISGVSVADIMDQAGLTHGGFYSHFASKERLLGAAVKQAGGETIEALSKTVRSLPLDRRIHAVIDNYLSVGHAEHPERGCPLAALGPELARVGGKVRQDFTRAVEERIDWFRNLLPGDPTARENAVGTVACLVGGLILARVVGGRQSDNLLAATRRFLHRALEHGVAEAGSRRRARKRRGDGN